MIKIGIISDSHQKTGLTQEAVEMLKSNGAMYLIHGGDLVTEENLKILDNSGLVYRAVFGNNDRGLIPLQTQYHIHMEPYYFKIKDIKFKLMHIPHFLSADSDIIIFGHTHKFETSYKNNTLYINPGEICAREKNKTEAVMLEIDDNFYKVYYYSKDPLETSWDMKLYQYERVQ